MRISPIPVTVVVSCNAEASFTSLPQELFCKIVAFIGPTSNSLCALGQITRDHRAVMTTIGDAMLPRAKLRFRTPLPPMKDCESSISLFVRHSRVAKEVHDNLEVLSGVLKKDFPVVDIPPLDDGMKYSSELSLTHNAAPPALIPNDIDIVKPAEVDTALNLALCLLGAGEQHYFGDMDRAIETANNAATTALEWRVSSLCGQLGAKAYKYAKSRIFSPSDDDMFSAYAVTDEMPFEDESDDEQDSYFESSDAEEAEDMKRMDKASLVMQLVVLRDMDAARQIRLILQNSQGANEYESLLRG